MAAINKLEICLQKFNTDFERFYKDFFNEKVDLKEMDEELVKALQRSVNSLRYWGKKFDILQDPCRLMITTFSSNVSSRPSTLDLLKALGKVYDISKLKEVYFSENRNYIGLEFSSVEDLNFVKQKFRSFEGNYIVLVDWLAEAKIYNGKIHWLPSNVDLEKVSEYLSKFFILNELNKVKFVIHEELFVYTNVITFSGLLRVGCDIQTIPHLAEMLNHKVLITIKGRRPLCLKCKKVGHIRKECLYSFCTTCKMELLKSHDCTIFKETTSYADIAKKSGNDQNDSSIMDSSIYSDKKQLSISNSDNEWIEVRKVTNKNYIKKPTKPVLLDEENTEQLKVEKVISGDESDLSSVSVDLNVNKNSSEEQMSTNQQLKRKPTDQGAEGNVYKIISGRRADENVPSTSWGDRGNIYDILASEDSEL